MIVETPNGPEERQIVSIDLQEETSPNRNRLRPLYRVATLPGERALYSASGRVTIVEANNEG